MCVLFTELSLPWAQFDFSAVNELREERKGSFMGSDVFRMTQFTTVMLPFAAKHITRDQFVLV
jgi:hypothetical protein